MRRLAVLLLLLLVGCGHMLFGSGGAGGSASWSFVVVVHNRAAVPCQVSISTPLDGYAAVNSFVTIQPGSSATWLCGQDATPDNVFIHNPATWGPPGSGWTGLYWYDQVYRVNSEYGPTDKWFEFYYP